MKGKIEGLAEGVNGGTDRWVDGGLNGSAVKGIGRGVDGGR